MANMRSGHRVHRLQPQRQVAMQSILHSLPEAVFVFDLQQRVVDLNYPAEQLTRLSRSELLGDTGRTLVDRIVGYDRSSGAESLVARALRGEFVRHERRFLRMDAEGKLLEILISGSPLQDVSGAIVGAVVVMQDVSELSTLQRRLESSDRHFEVGQMTASLAHDFNNVLNTIAQAQTVLELNRERSSADRKMFSVIGNAVARGSEIVANIREYLRGNRDTRSVVDVPQLLDEVLGMLQPMLEAHAGVAVKREFESVPQVRATGPELQRVFTNLILNALEAMPQGGSLTVRCRKVDGKVLASFSDTGHGIAAEHEREIFVPYFTTKPEGTGLGLSGARRTVLAHGGEIRFETQTGRGTTFYVILPAATANDRKSHLPHAA